MVLAHCSLGHSGSWARLIQQLVGQNTIAFDLPDHGRTAPTPAGTCLQRLSADILLEEISQTDGPVHLIGHSFGGTAALLAALDNPTNLKHLTLIEPVQFCAAKGTSAHAEHHAALSDYIAAWTNGDRTKASIGFMNVWGGGTSFQSLPPQQQSYIQDRIHIIAAQGSALNDDTNGILTQERLETLTVPITFIEGLNSPSIASAIIDHLACRIPNTTRHRMPNAGHMLPITHAAQVAALIASRL
ncbi:MAG: alpha/beta fold hydrolase [Planktomarina sp.]